MMELVSFLEGELKAITETKDRQESGPVTVSLEKGEHFLSAEHLVNCLITI